MGLGLGQWGRPGGGAAAPALFRKALWRRAMWGPARGGRRGTFALSHPGSKGLLCFLLLLWDLRVPQAGRGAGEGAGGVTSEVFLWLL